LGNVDRLIKEVQLRILYCSENYSPHDHRFLTAMVGSGHEIFWLRLEEGGRVQENRQLSDSVHQVNWRNDHKPISWPYTDELITQFKATIDRIKPDLVHAGPVQSVAYLPAQIGFHPLLTMSWGFDLLEDARRNKDWEDRTSYVLNQSDWFTSDCQTTKNIAVNYGMPESRTTVFPWGVDLNLFNPEQRGFMRHEVGYEKDLVIVHTRSWEPRYGVDIALQGFWQALQTEPNLRLLMMGGGSQEGLVRQFVADKDLSDHVHFCGYLQNETFSKYYQAADVYLSASHIDGSSVALMESMACGCPALVSDIPANLEWITDGEQGWVFKDNDPDNLAEKIINISRTRKENHFCGEKARKKAEANADWSKNFTKLLNTYDRIMQISR
jgi:glycosyltransferase involved in cell wall biosynthesis